MRLKQTANSRCLIAIFDDRETMNEQFTLPSAAIVDILSDARRHTLALISDLGDEQLMGPQLDIVNPLLWEIGHIAFFHEVFVLRELGDREPLLDVADEFYDSFEVAHDDRWGLLLPTRFSRAGRALIDELWCRVLQGLSRVHERLSVHVLVKHREEIEIGLLW